MRLGIAHLVFGSISAATVGFNDAIDQPLPSIPATEPSMLHQIRQSFLSDKALAENLQSGDADALTALFERHAPRLLGVARRILRNEADAEDAVQQIFLDAFRSIQQFDPEKGTLKTWLFMFGYQRIFNFHRSRVSSRFFATDPFDESLSALPLEPDRSSTLSQAETAVLIQQVLSNLQPRQRRTIELVYYEGLTAEEISVRTGETVRVVRHNLYRGLEKLRKTVCGPSPARAKGGKR
jgi:RNA polymerase sigma-70 factor, ECF subfamily